MGLDLDFWNWVFGFVAEIFDIFSAWIEILKKSASGYSLICIYVFFLFKNLDFEPISGFFFDGLTFSSGKPLSQNFLLVFLSD